MIWESAEQFLQMGGHGLYIWGSLAATVLLLGGECIALRARRKTSLRRIARLHRPHRNPDARHAHANENAH